MGVITALFSAERVTGAATSTSHPNPASKTATPGWSHNIFGQFVTGLVGSLKSPVKFQGRAQGTGRSLAGKGRSSGVRWQQVGTAVTPEI